MSVLLKGTLPVLREYVYTFALLVSTFTGLLLKIAAFLWEALQPLLADCIKYSSWITKYKFSCTKTFSTCHQSLILSPQNVLQIISKQSGKRETNEKHSNAKMLKCAMHKLGTTSAKTRCWVSLPTYAADVKANRQQNKAISLFLTAPTSSDKVEPTRLCVVSNTWQLLIRSC